MVIADVAMRERELPAAICNNEERTERYLLESGAKRLWPGDILV